MWHVKIVDGVLKQEPGPLEPGASSRSLAEFVSHALAAEPGWWRLGLVFRTEGARDQM